MYSNIVGQFYAVSMFGVFDLCVLVHIDKGLHVALAISFVSVNINTKHIP